MKYMGIDIHKKMCQAAVLDEDGTPLDEIRFRNDVESIEDFAMKLTPFRDEVKVKTDKVDSRTLARLLSADMLHTWYVPDEEQRSWRELLRHRLCRNPPYFISSMLRWMIR